MGYRTYDISYINPCWVEDGYVCVRLYSGTVVKYKTALPFNIPEQTNIFVNDRIAFWLFYEDKTVIGRNDGSISIYRTKDSLLVGLNYFEYEQVPLVRIGFATGMYKHSMLPVRLDVRDMKTIYSGYDGVALIDKMPSDLDLDLAMRCCLAKDPEAHGCYVYRQGGERVAFRDWIISSRIQSPDRRVDL